MRRLCTIDPIPKQVICRDEACLVLVYLPLTPDPSPTPAGRGTTLRVVFAPLPEFGEGPGVGSVAEFQHDHVTPLSPFA